MIRLLETVYVCSVNPQGQLDAVYDVILAAMPVDKEASTQFHGRE